ncbi:MAG: SCO family protein [Sinobacteraceae bacterium]|nr:SCO family protein [Nevskiaceae bacterium]
MPVRLHKWLPVLLLTAVLAACHGGPPWHLRPVRHVVADLRFDDLPRAGGGLASARDFRGKLVLLYFGYSHCPDVCQITLALLSGVLRQLGPQAQDVRVLFVTVDPARDTPPVLARYIRIFGAPQIVGLVPSPAQLTALAKRYRIAYTLQPPDAQGNYEVDHSSGIFVFDRAGRARLLGTDTQPPLYFVEDLRRLLAEPAA